MQDNIVIVGSGIAGLTLAYKLSVSLKETRITLITKAALNDCNTRYAQGGIAAVMDTQRDSFEAHIRDTLACGKDLCDPSVVDMVIKQAPERIKELLNWGVHFDQSQSNEFDLALEGGHSHARVLHHKDLTGFELESLLISKIRSSASVRILEYHTAMDLLIQSEDHQKSCIGIQVLDVRAQKIKFIHASKLILASGGCGQIYLNTTNPSVATGDGYAMAARAGAEMRDMRFMQFHPTAIFSDHNEPVSFLISEAVRGFGAHIIDHQGERFLFRYDKRGELATRDVVSSAIADHLEHTKRDCVFLDLRHLDPQRFAEHFPSIRKQLNYLHLDPSYELIPVVPSAHYQCGGIKVNKEGESSILNLYAIGEVSSTGLHGANRLASNSLLEALVYAHNAAMHIIANRPNSGSNQLPQDADTEIHVFDNREILHEIWQDVKHRMSSSAFKKDRFLLIKDRDHLLHLCDELELQIQAKVISTQLLDLRNSVTTAALVLIDQIKSVAAQPNDFQTQLVN